MIMMSPNRIVRVPVLLNLVELDIVDQLASEKGLSRSACLREAALEKAKEKGISYRDPRVPKKK
jgi:hypothetical protein